MGRKRSSKFQSLYDGNKIKRESEDDVLRRLFMAMHEGPTPTLEQTIHEAFEAGYLNGWLDREASPFA